VSALPSQQPGLTDRYGLTQEDVDRWVWLIEPSGERKRGAAAVAGALREMGGGWRLLGHLAQLPGSALVYRFVARNRGLLSHLWGDRPPY